MPTNAPTKLATEGETIPASGPLAPSVSLHPKIMRGEPCLRDLRIPVTTLFDHLHFGEPFDALLAGFPEVPGTRAIAVIDLAAKRLLSSLAPLGPKSAKCSPAHIPVGM